MVGLIKNSLGSRPWLLGLIVVPIGIAKYGLDVWPGWTNLREASMYMPNPTQAPSLLPPQDYILGSPALVGLAWATGLNSPWGFFLLSCVLTLIALTLPFFMGPFKNDFAQAMILFVFVVGGSLLPFLLTWIGVYDSITIIGATLGVLAKRKWLAGLGWLVVGFNHWQLGLVMLLIALPLLIGLSGLRHESTSVKKVFVPVGALFVGFLFNWALIQSWGGITSRSEIVSGYGFGYYFNGLLAVLPIAIFSSLGVGWFLLIRKESLHFPEALWLACAAIVASIMLPLVALDQSRTIAMALYPALLVFASKYTQLYGIQVSKQVIRWYTIVAMVVPIPLALAGAIDHNSWQSLLSLRGLINGV